MKTSFQSLLVLLSISLATSGRPAMGQEWTSFPAGELSGFSFGHSHLTDGRFVFGIDGTVSVQDDFDFLDFTTVANPDGRVFDPSFIAIRSGTAGLIGGGGFLGPTGLFPFDPSAPATAVGRRWFRCKIMRPHVLEHPTSGREGWLISGGNGAGGANNLTYVSADGCTAVRSPAS
jgi:hypothetical protein